jgi:cytochrome P450
MDYIGGQAAADSLRFTRLANGNMAERANAEKQAQSSGKGTRKDVFHYLLRSRDPETGKGFSREDLQAESGLLITAGSDGVALTISAAVFYLLRNPAVLTQLTKEIRAAFQDVSDIRNPKLSALIYLQACVDETLRISPALPSMMPREVLAGGIDIGSCHIPKGITVGVPAYAIHHNEMCYPS